MNTINMKYSLPNECAISSLYKVSGIKIIGKVNMNNMACLPTIIGIMFLILEKDMVTSPHLIKYDRLLKVIALNKNPKDNEVINTTKILESIKNSLSNKYQVIKEGYNKFTSVIQPKVKSLTFTDFKKSNSGNFIILN